MRTPIYIRRGNKVDLPVLNAGEPGFATDTKELFIGSSSGNISLPNKTIANLTYYVDAVNGNDANDGLAAGAGRALKTIMAAVNKISQIDNHAAVVNVAPGTYNEDIVIKGFSGSGALTITGSNGAVSDSYLVSSFTVSQCGIIVTITGFKATTTTQTGFYCERSVHTVFDYCKCDAAASSQNAVRYAASASGRVSNGIFSNRANGIIADFASTVYSSNNSGTGNTTGLQAIAAATIGKNGTQPAGTTAEVQGTGGVIR